MTKPANELVAAHGEMGSDGFRITWDLDQPIDVRAHSTVALTATLRHPWGSGLELALFITPNGATQCASGATVNRARITEQRSADYVADEYSVETVFPRRWLQDFRNEMPLQATLSVNGGDASAVVGTAFVSPVAA
jgi:hypothetical protein